MAELRISSSDMLRSDLTVYNKLRDAGAPIAMSDGVYIRYDVTVSEDPFTGDYVYRWKDA